MGPPRILALLASLFAVTSWLSLSVGASEKAVAGVQIAFPGLEDKVYVTYSASQDARAPSESEALETRLYEVPKNHDGCGTSSLRPPESGGHWTVVLSRGGACNFRDKIIKARKDGARAVIIVNAVKGLYNSTDNTLRDACSLNCETGLGDTQRTCESSGCYKCAENVKIGSGEFCCVEDTLIDMYVGKTIGIPAFFASIETGERTILPRAKMLSPCRIFERPTYEVDPSLFFIGTLGCTVLALASYRAASKERATAAWIWSTSSTKEQIDLIRTTHDDLGHEQMHLTVGQAGGFVITSTCVLVFIFLLVQYFPHSVVRVLQFLFALGATGAMAKLMFTPLFRKLMGPYYGDRPIRSCPSSCVDETGETTVAKTSALGVSGAVALLWLVFRHEPWAWLLLDLLAANLAASFLLTIRLPSLRVGAALLTAFFFYDIFMVFITPAIFSGRSVMVDVATAGRAREKADAFKCYRQVEEQVPMLFTVPRFDWYGGYSLLGLGDIVLPGLLVVLALRFDYAKLRYQHQDFEEGTTPFPKPSFTRVHAYYIPIVVAYCLGLTLTFVANVRGWTINGVRGQPALLYLVPTTLGVFIFLAWVRGDFAAVWSTRWQEWEELWSGERVHDPEENVQQNQDDRVPSL